VPFFKNPVLRTINTPLPELVTLKDDTMTTPPTGVLATHRLATSKRAGEDSLRAMIPELSNYDVNLVVVSGDTIIVSATRTPKQGRCPGTP